MNLYLCEPQQQTSDHAVHDHDHTRSPLVTALGRYMNTLALHGIAAERRLRKRGDRWRVLEKEEVVAKDSEECTDNVQKNVLVFAFYTPWYTAASRNIQKRSSQQERVEVRAVELQRQAAVREKEKARRAGGSKSAGPMRSGGQAHNRPRRTARYGSLSAHGERASLKNLRSGAFDDIPCAKPFSTATLVSVGNHIGSGSERRDSEPNV
jgi:hypothetical protein